VHPIHDGGQAVLRAAGLIDLERFLGEQRAARSAIASRIRLWPIEAASTTPPEALKLSLPAGLPPVESIVASSTMRPAAASWLTRAVTAVRDNPVTRPISDRLFPWPDRISWRIWPAVAG